MDEQNRDITEDEAALYDRQIRIWGVQSQNMLRNSQVLVVGVTTLQLEVCKNLVLAGIGSLSVWDADIVSQDSDFSVHYLLHASDIGLNKAEAVVPRISELNPNVKVDAISDDLDLQSSDIWTRFDVVCVSGQSLRWVHALEERLCSLKHPPAFFICESLNFDGFFCQNLFKHSFVLFTPGENGAPDQREDKEIEFPNIADAFSTALSEIYCAFGRRCKQEASIFASVLLVYAFEKKFGRWPTASNNVELLEMQSTTAKITPEVCLLSKDVMNVVQNWRVESAPGAAVLGGLLSQEILKTITRKDAPLLNVTVFNGWGNSAVNVQIPNQISSN